jgi:hypothetical protein
MLTWLDFSAKPRDNNTPTLPLGPQVLFRFCRMELNPFQGYRIAHHFMARTLGMDVAQLILIVESLGVHPTEMMQRMQQVAAVHVRSKREAESPALSDLESQMEIIHPL